ncbi:MAG: hypothetical protein GY774_40180 [Planctomycetes bacterium]|nr:hypothetical protein [Planctomycetota bacterium]
MTNFNKHKFAITPMECLAQLPEIPLDFTTKEGDDGLRRAELRQSVLAIAELNHVSETAIVRAVVKNAIGRLPELEE